jgi:hypothetical protein
MASLVETLLSPIIDALKKAFAPFAKLFDFLTHVWSNVTNLFTDVQTLVQSVIAEINAWRNFKENISFQNRLVSLPVAYEQTKAFILQIPAAWHAIVDLFNELKGKFETTGNPTEEAENALKDIEESGFKSILKQFPKLAKGLEKVVGFAAILADALESIITGVHDLQTIVDTLKGIREEIESAQTIFLKQSNPRRIVKLADGSTMKIRVGNLHS